MDIATIEVQKEHFLSVFYDVPDFIFFTYEFWNITRQGCVMDLTDVVETDVTEFTVSSKVDDVTVRIQ